jgi:teichoic acid transport system permease protein
VGSRFTHLEGGKVVHDLPGLSWALLWYLPLLVILALENFGLAMLFSTMSVYFRDTSKFLTYMLRIWLYITPVLYDVDKFKDHKWALYLNPMGPVIGSITELWTKATPPSAAHLVAALAWSFGLFIFGAWFFVSRERDFAVRI